MAATRPAPFRPQFTLLLLYFGLFFVLFALLAVLPDLLAILRDAEQLPPEARPAPEALEERARVAARQAMQGKVLLVFVLALLATGGLAWAGRLPGLRAPRRQR